MMIQKFYQIAPLQLVFESGWGGFSVEFFEISCYGI